MTLAAVKGNRYHSRQQVIDMAGDNWIRINVTAVDGVPGNYDVDINMDVYDADYGSADDWIFFGDSITADAMGHSTVAGVKAFAQLINAHMPNNFPVQEAGGIGFLTSADGAKYIKTWLRLFPGKYVGISYGTNDALRCTSADSFYANYLRLYSADSFYANYGAGCFESGQGTNCGTCTMGKGHIHSELWSGAECPD
jgi:lysophospholipase L1-like esterase